MIDFLVIVVVVVVVVDAVVVTRPPVSPPPLPPPPVSSSSFVHSTQVFSLRLNFYYQYARSNIRLLSSS
ncbi:hypothetical protein AND_008728 [Anopheles darlingi]|uniref:Secreted protein n=1 Tax=Anopheles darlingi TaxID=43151 RepID=W5JAB2_ANODA|nr:hypothetical protein AND_008728 [Anopheles darlingi]